MDAPSSKRNDEWSSGSFGVGGLDGCRLEFCPRGTAAVGKWCTVAFRAPIGWAIRAAISVDGQEKICDELKIFNDETDFLFDVFPLSECYRNIGVRILSSEPSTFVWDISGRDVEAARMDDQWVSEKFNIAGVDNCQLDFCPKGTSCVNRRCTLSFRVPRGLKVRSMLFVDDVEKPCDETKAFDEACNLLLEVFDPAAKYRKVGVRLLSVEAFVE